MVALAVVALLASMILPSFGRAREMAARTVCGNHCRVIASSFWLYAEDSGGCAPPIVGAVSSCYDLLAPYWGQAGNAPRECQPWWGGNGCPSYRPGASRAYLDVAITITRQRRDRRLAAGAESAQTVLTCDGWSDFPASTLESLFTTVTGMTVDGQIGVFPRHAGDGINAAFLDGRQEFLPYYRDPASGTETFLPRNPKLF